MGHLELLGVVQVQMVLLARNYAVLKVFHNRKLKKRPLGDLRRYWIKRGCAVTLLIWLIAVLYSVIYGVGLDIDMESEHRYYKCVFGPHEGQWMLVIVFILLLCLNAIGFILSFRLVG